MTRFTRLFVLGVLIGLMLSLFHLQAQAPPAKPEVPPVLSEVDRLKIINALQSVELWSLKMQAAAQELQKARMDADKLITTVTPEGWQLNEQLQFVKKEK